MRKFPKILPAVAVSVLALTALSGCFTGIEKTPEIKSSGSAKSSTKLTAEQDLLSDVSQQTVAQWLPGKPFIATGGRLSYAYTPAIIAETLAPGDTLRYRRMRSNLRLSGDSITEVVLLTPGGSEISTVVEVPMGAIADKPLNLPFTVDADLVSEVRQRLVGKTVWTLRVNRAGKKYQKTKITDVVAGTPDFPLLVATPGDTVLMALNSRGVTSRTFENLFSLSDPRRRYPQVSDANWQLICSGRIATDMTREECRLSLGAPADIDRNVTYSGIVERWTYEDGKFLIFTDGILTRFRL